MKRRVIEAPRPRRGGRRNRLVEFTNATNSHVKVLCTWILVCAMNYWFGFHLEYLWPLWLLVCSLYDSYRFQGVAFSALFVGFTLTSDAIVACLLPLKWLFFTASTAVWVQYVYQTERAISLPTIGLWLLFITFEWSMRLQDYGSPHVDLCRPFAVHCIGYPVVTLGFGLKSYVTYKLRLRRQTAVEQENRFCYELIAEAVPEEFREQVKENYIQSHCVDRPQPPDELTMDDGIVSVRSEEAGEIPTQNKTEKSTSRKPTSSQNQVSNGRKKANRKEDLQLTPSEESRDDSKSDKENKYARLELDSRRLKAEIQLVRSAETEIRLRLERVSSEKRVGDSENQRLRGEFDSLQSKLASALAARNTEKQQLAAAERKLSEERKLRSTAETQLASERKQNSRSGAVPVKVECGSDCRQRRRDLESELSSLRVSAAEAESQAAAIKVECEAARRQLSLREAEFRRLREERDRIECDLVAENRLKLELLGALTEAKKMADKQDMQISTLETELARSLALPTTYSVYTHDFNFNDPAVQPAGTLNPNAQEYLINN